MTSRPDDWARVRALFEAALSQPAELRLAHIASSCGDDQQLREDVESLLASHERASGFLGTQAALATLDTVNTSFEGRRVGPFQIVREIGRGGMGSVYLGERADGEFAKQVAIKFVGGIPNEILRRRFHEERRILAALEHPTIARLLDGGTTADGLPYLVMEYVDGVAIDAFCEQRDLTTRARIELFRQVCQAVQYLHQHLVIHRDIKTSNILVTPDGTPKLLDFGIAKLVDPGREQGLTLTLECVMTPDSASPEQVRGEPVTVSTDVYALGVLLYRLLTGRSPYASAPSNQSALLKAICDEMPRPPSVAAGASVASARKRIDRDLDQICLKALRKEPEHRYQSVGQLLEDLQRFLEGRPVLAVTDSRRYRTKKFLQRHRALVSIGSVALLAVLIGAGIALYQAHIAKLERIRAERRFDDVRRLANSFLFEFHDAIADLPGSLEARKLVVKRAAEYLDRLAAEAQDDVALKREIATAYERLGTILGGGGVSNLADFPTARARYQSALRIREALAARADAEPDDLTALATLRVQMARFFALTGDLGMAEETAARAVTLLQSTADSQGTTGRLGQLATAHHQLGYVQARRGENQAALESLDQALTRAKQQVSGRPDDVDDAARLARIQIDYGEQLLQAQRATDAYNALHDAQGTFERLLIRAPLNAGYQQNLVRIFKNQGDALEGIGRTRDALAAFSSAVTVAEALRGSAPDDHASQVAVMISHFALGVALVNAGQRQEGIPHVREAIAVGESIVKAAPGNGFVLNELAEAKLRLGETLLANPSQRAEGCREIGDGLRIWNSLTEVPGESGRFRDRFEVLWAVCSRPSAPPVRR
ncbi:MAG TPA: protein kinase [Vicinamibacterales bacterium]|nr:protein kinase [Vicinamibacterales bacterium]